MPVRKLDEKTVTALVADATAAPSMHNAQPWVFRLLRAEHTLELRADLGRAMRRSDPGNRSLHIGCGAALFNLRVSAAHAGLAAEVKLLPDPSDPLLLAAVRPAGPAAGNPPDEALAALHPAIRQRHTSRHPFAEKDLPEAVRGRLRDAAAREGAVLVFPGPWHLDTLLELVRDAEARDTACSADDDLARWTRLGAAADTATDGVPEYAFGPRKRDGRAPARDFAGRRPAADRGTTGFEHTPQLALLGTAQDEPADWLRAGQALERVLLEATLDDLATSLSSHPLESSDLRSLTRDPLSDMGRVQMILRIGYGPRGPATPRRPVREVLDIV